MTEKYAGFVAVEDGIKNDDDGTEVRKAAFGGYHRIFLWLGWVRLVVFEWASIC